MLAPVAAIVQEALAASQALPLEHLMRAAAELRDAGHRHITFSPQVFIPLTRLCRDRWVWDVAWLVVTRHVAVVRWR